uniref:Uncharacterized protein n=1 Tax=Arundo donax TaxID=35708 RepID=A0A0A9CH39_ARUDO
MGGSAHSRSRAPVGSRRARAAAAMTGERRVVGGRDSGREEDGPVAIADVSGTAGDNGARRTDRCRSGARQWRCDVAGGNGGGEVATPRLPFPRRPQGP